MYVCSYVVSYVSMIRSVLSSFLSDRISHITTLCTLVLYPGHNIDLHAIRITIVLPFLLRRPMDS